MKANDNGKWENLKGILTDHFGKVQDKSGVWKKLKDTRQIEGEKVKVFGARLLNVAKEYWSQDSVDSDLGQGQLVEVFVDGLISNQVARAVLQKGEVKFSEVLATAAIEEALVDSLRTRGRGLKEEKTGRQGTQGSSQAQKPVVCGACGRQGHNSTECRSKGQAKTSNSRESIICYQCGKQGHISRECPTGGSKNQPTARPAKAQANPLGHPRGVNPPPPFTSSMRCSCCGLMGHTFRDCERRPYTQRHPCERCNRYGHVLSGCNFTNHLN